MGPGVTAGTADPLAGPIDDLHEIGPARAKALRSLGVATLGDLIEYFPRDYQYETEEKPLDGLREGEIGIARGEVTAVNYISGGHGKPRFEATLSTAHTVWLSYFSTAHIFGDRFTPGFFFACGEWSSISMESRRWSIPSGKKWMPRPNRSAIPAFARFIQPTRKFPARLSKRSSRPT